MRILFFAEDGQPLRMKTLSLTFSELRSQLITKWEYETHRHYESEYEKAFPDVAAMRAVHRPQNQSPSDLITWRPGIKWEKTPV